MVSMQRSFSAILGERMIRHGEMETGNGNGCLE
jgi:hypothetical protein